MRLTVVQRKQAVLGLSAAAAVAILLAAAGSCGTDDDGNLSAHQAQEQKQARKKRKQLPGGGRELFPHYRVVALYGNPRDKELGELGIGTPTRAGIKLRRQARAYARKTRPALPAMELITTLATAAPGPRGVYSERQPFAMIDRYLKAARKANALLILDIQPGRAPFGPEIERLRRYLIEPDVGLALDPEWHVGPDQVPGHVIGSMHADNVNAAAAYLGQLAEQYDLPEKLLLVHRFTPDMIVGAERLRKFPRVATVVNVDGFGTPAAKTGKYKQFATRGKGIGNGFKLFYSEDTDVMSPKQVMALSPRPDVVVYE